MLKPSCIHDCSDDDCNKCAKHGIIGGCIPWCPDYDDGCGGKWEDDDEEDDDYK